MGQQNQCCGHKDLKNNEEFVSTKVVRMNKIVSQKVATDALSTIVRKQMQKLHQYQPKNPTILPKGTYSETYEEIQKPKGFYHGEWANDKFHGSG